LLERGALCFFRFFLHPNTKVHIRTYSFFEEHYLDEKRSMPRARKATPLLTRSLDPRFFTRRHHRPTTSAFAVLSLFLSKPSLLTVQGSQGRQRRSRRCRRPGHEDARSTSKSSRSRGRGRAAALLLWRSDKSDDHRRRISGASRQRCRTIAAPAPASDRCRGARVRLRGRERGERRHTVQKREKSSERARVFDRRKKKKTLRLCRRPLFFKLFFFSLSRLFSSSVITLPLLQSCQRPHHSSRGLACSQGSASTKAVVRGKVRFLAWWELRAKESFFGLAFPFLSRASFFFLSRSPLSLSLELCPNCLRELNNAHNARSGAI